MSSNFVTVRVEILRDQNLTPIEKLILGEIEALSSLEHGCIASNQHFSELLGIKKESASRSISALVSKGYINSEIENGSRNHNRMLTLNKLLFDPKQNVITPLTKCLETKGNKQTNRHINRQEFPVDVERWIAYRKEIKKPIKKITIENLVKDYVQDPLAFYHKVEHSITNGYQGLFAPKASTKETTRSVDYVADFFAKREQGNVEVIDAELN